MPERVLADIESLEEAVKIVRAVESTYHRAIEENISSWWAVEEDIIDSYTNLINKTEDEKVKSTLAQIIPDLRNHIEVLESMRESFKKMLADVQRHGKMLQALYFDEEPKKASDNT